MTSGTHAVGTAPRVDWSPPSDATFALCLTHDVDRPYKGLRALYYGLRERSVYHFKTALSADNPYWQFEEIMRLEDDLGVRSAFYVLNEQHLLRERPVSDWFHPTHWVQHLGRYDVTAPDVRGVLRELESGGWEVGLHGSYHSPDDRDRLHEEVTTLEELLDRPILGGRQHYLRLEVPDTWRHHRAIGLRYDASLGSSTKCGFHAGYRPLQPFDDEFVVFPLTIMEQALPDPGSDFEAARECCDRLLLEAVEHEAVMTVLWHPRYFNEREFPGYRKVYRWLLERAIDLGAWVGPPGEMYRELESRSRIGEPIENRNT